MAAPIQGPSADEPASVQPESIPANSAPAEPAQSAEAEAEIVPAESASALPAEALKEAKPQQLSAHEKQVADQIDSDLPRTFPNIEEGARHTTCSLVFGS